MTGHLKYHIRLTRFQFQRTRIAKAQAGAIRAARRAWKSPEEIEQLAYGEDRELEEVDEELSALITDHLISQARRLLLPVPERSDQDSWQECAVYVSRHVLTDRGIANLRTAIRTECKARIELAVIVTAVVTGLIGATTGLVAVLRG